MAERRALPHWARWTALGCAVAVTGAATYLVADAMPSSAATAGLVTATVSTGSVTQTIALSGSVERVDQVTAAFRTAGTVRSVKVAVGDEVAAGDVLATIGTADLKRAVTVAQADLVAAQAALDASASSSTSATTIGTSASPVSGSTSGTGTTSGSTPTPSVSPSAGPSASSSPRPSASPSPSVPKVDTSPVHQAVSEYRDLVQAAVTTCRPVVDAGSSPDPAPTPTPSPSDTPTPSPSPTQTPSAEPSSSAGPSTTSSPGGSDATTTVENASLVTGSSGDPTPEQVSACVQALSAALTSAQHTASEMDRLVTALDAAAKALQQQQSKAATSGTSGSTGTGSTGTGSTGTGSTGTGSTGTGSTGTGGTAASGASGGGSQSTAGLEVSVLKASQALASAEQDLDGAVLEAPISGTVGEVDLVKGSTAGTSSGVVIVGPGSAVVTVDLPLAQLGKVRVGQEVTVTPAGTTTKVPGLVQSIGVLPTSTTTSTPTYPVRVTVSDPPVSLAAGSTATATITLATATGVLTVPVSAVTGVSSGTGAVQTLSGTDVTPATVTVGAVGGGKAEIVSGLTAGQRVVLADPSTALPSSTIGRRSTTSGVSSLTGSGGGPGMGGPPPGG